MSAEGVKGNAGEVFAAFLRLGLTSFGGPIAHHGYFHSEFVERRNWLDEAAPFWKLRPWIVMVRRLS
jgi:chromate transporter